VEKEMENKGKEEEKTGEMEEENKEERKKRRKTKVGEREVRFKGGDGK
jgi:hypothetical protein